MINLHIKSELSMFTYYEAVKGNAKCRIWSCLGCLGSPEITSSVTFDKVHTTAYLTLTETMQPSCTIFEL